MYNIVLNSLNIQDEDILILHAPCDENGEMIYDMATCQKIV